MQIDGLVTAEFRQLLSKIHQRAGKTLAARARPRSAQDRALERRDRAFAIGNQAAAVDA